MDEYKNIQGIHGDVFEFKDGDGPKLRAVGDQLEVRDPAGSNYAPIKAKQVTLAPTPFIGAPITGTWEMGTMIIDALGWLYWCIESGTPGRWATFSNLGFSNIDGGSSSAVYTARQHLDGGSADSIYTLRERLDCGYSN